MFCRTALFALLAGFASYASATTYTVTNTNDSGAGSLRQAISDASANPGADTIAFNITGSGVHTIALASSLPDISGGSLTIDGYTQPGSSPNDNPPDQGSNAVLRVEIDGQNHGCVNAGTSTLEIRGLNLHGCQGPSVALGFGSGSVVAGNFIGTDPTGMTSASLFGQDGVFAQGSSNSLVGGPNPGDGNVIAGQTGEDVKIVNGTFTVQGNLIGVNAAGTASLARPGAKGISIESAAGTIGGMAAGARNVVAGYRVQSSSGFGIYVNNVGQSVTIQGNFVGSDVSGTKTIPNYIGVRCAGACQVGGSAPDAGNVIVGSQYFGYTQGAPSGSVLQGNFIGTDKTGTLALGNAQGVSINGPATVGGTGPGEGNIIAFNGSSDLSTAISVSGTGTRIRGNRIFRNTARGIDLGPADANPHADDAGDSDTGPNNLQNYPIIKSVDYGASTTVHGSLNSTPATTFDVDFYANPACDPRAPLGPQGEEYVGSTQVTTDGSGNAAIDFILPNALGGGQPVTAIATDPAGNSSEFSQSLILSTNAPHGFATGFPGYVITGQLFEVGATVTVGGVPLTDVVVNDASHITATMPALPYGSVGDVVVTNPSGLSGTLDNGFIADFHDVNGVLSPFDDDIFRLVRSEIAVGVGGGYYGTTDNIKRQAMAVFLLKTKHGICYAPPPCTGVFTDVPCSSNFAPWIEAMAAEGITGGCGNGNFCPASPVRRDQMAVFLLKGKHGSDFVPPPCTGVFTDVPCPGPFADWIEQLKIENVTGGCGGTNYCPSAINTRGQMATFMVKTFGLP